MDKKTIKQLINQYNNMELQELVCHIVSKNKKAQQALLEYCQEHDENPKSEKHNLIIEKQLQQHWMEASQIIEQFDMYGGGPASDEDDAYYELEKMEALLEDNKVSWKVRKEILDEMLEFVASDNSGFTDTLVDIALLMCETKEENIYLANFLNQNGNFYYSRLAEKIYLQNGEEQKFLESKKANLQFGSDYLELADYYKKHGEEKKALNIVLEGLEKAEGGLDEIYEYLFRYYKKKQKEDELEKLYKNAEKKQRNQDTITKLMYQYYKEKGDYKKQKGALFKLLDLEDNRKLYELYQKCKQELKCEDFETEEKEILQIIKKRDLLIYFDILLDKNQPKEVIEYLTNSPQSGKLGWRLDEGHRFSKRLSEQYPREVVEMYWKEVDFYVGLGKEKNYNHAVSVLKDIQKIMKRNKWQDEWNIKFQNFLEQHKRKKLLLKELEGFRTK